MKKITLFLSLLLTVFITATAEIDTSKEYLIQDVTSGKFLNAANNTTHDTGTNGGVNFVDYAGTDSQILTFEASGSGYKLKFRTGKYVYCQSWNVDALDNGTVLTFIDNGDGTYYIQNGTTYFKSELVSGTYYPFCNADENARTKVKLVALTAPVGEVTSGIYEIQNQDATGSRGYLVHSTSYANKIKLAESKYPNMTSTTYCFQSRTESGVTPYWYVYNSEAGNTYIFSLATGQFINDTSSSDAVALTTTPQPVNIQNVSGTIFNIKSTIRDTYTLTAAVGWKQSDDNVRWYNANTDDGYPFHFISVSTIIDAGIITVDQDIINNAIEAIKNAETVPEEEDLSETLAPDFGIDVLGAKIDGYNGTFSENTNANGYTYTNYRKLVSEKTVKQWKHEGSNSTYIEVPMVTIEATTKDQYGTADAYKLNTSVLNNNTTILTLSYAVPTIMTLTAPEGYHIVGYKFTYTTTDAILDTDYYDGEISQAAAGESNVEVKNLDAASTEIAFGGYNNSSSSTVTISNFYVFIRKSVFLTAKRLSAFQEDAGNCWYYNYTIASKRNPNNHIYAPEGKDILDLCGEGCNKNGSVQVTASDNNQRFMLIPISAYYADSKQTKYAGCYFLYNVGHGKFVSKEGNNTLLTEYPRNAVEIIAGEGDYAGLFQLKFNKENLLNVSTGYCEADDETTSCIITNYNTSDDGNNFYLREFNTREEEDIVDAYSIQQDVWYGANADTEVKEAALAKLDELLAKSGVGYPSNNTSITSTKSDIESGFGLTYFDLDYYINQYKTTTDVNMPESGKAYRIYAKYANGDKRYLYRSDVGVLRMSNAGEEPTGYAGTFILKSVSEAANGQGTYAFAHDSGEYMVYATDKEEGVGGSTTGFVSAYEQGDHDADITLITAANKTANQGGVANVAGDFFGGFLLQGYNQKNNGLYYLMGGENNSGTTTNLHRGNNSDIYYSNIRSSIFYVEEASYPNVANMRCAAYNSDDKSYASIWLPFDVEIPEGVKAYTARINKANSTLVLDLVEGDYLPSECAAILIGETENKITLIPAKEKAEAISTNQLMGTNIAGQAPATDKKTFVLNGAKTKGIGFYPYTAANLPTYKAYIEMDAAMAAQGLRFSFATPTGIEETITEGEQDAKVYYDLSGRRVAQPTKGLYIVNGKKMYIK